MARKRLTWWERRIRERGIPPSEWLSVVALFLLASWFGQDDVLIIECTGQDPSDWRGRSAITARIVAGAVCSPLYVFQGIDGSFKLLLFMVALVWLGGMIWLHRARQRYWRPRAQRANRLARERRAKKRAEKAADNEREI